MTHEFVLLTPEGNIGFTRKYSFIIYITKIKKGIYVSAMMGEGDRVCAVFLFFFTLVIQVNTSANPRREYRFLFTWNCFTIL